MREIRNAYRILVEKPEGKGPLGRPRHRWEDNIGKDIREAVDWIHLTQDREHGNETSGSINGREFLDQLRDLQLLKKDSASWS
jgi:hypothetical protein